MIRGGLKSMIYDYSLLAESDINNGSEASVLMSTDIERISSGLKWMYEPVFNLFEAGLASWLLWRQVGVSTITMIALILSNLSFFIAP